MIKQLATCAMILLLIQTVQGQTQQEPVRNQTSTNGTGKWVEKIAVRGYVQLRLNGLYQSNPNLACPQCDRSWGGNSDLFLRRMRLIVFGQVHERVYIYIQPDFASSVSSDNLHFGQIRDAYIDLGIDRENEFRFRIGQSKVPYGFENLQSSQNRLPLDRNDALNSAVQNERDMGVYFMWAPKKVRQLYSDVVRSGLKGSGDYGVFAVGFYNGQTANKPELNQNKHLVARFSYPFLVRDQIIEFGVQGYTGKWTMPADIISSGVQVNADRTYKDQRVAATLNVYPKPFGVLAEYNVGVGPEYNKFTNQIEERNLEGGYITLNYMANIKGQILFPFVRMQYYRGGKKFEQDARSYEVNEYEFGVEWQPIKNFELVVMHTQSYRKFEDAGRPNNRQVGNLLRIQAQVNF